MGDVRPAGPLVWLHACTETQAIAFAELILRLSEDRGDLWFLITTQSPHVKSHLDQHLKITALPQTFVLLFSGDDARIASHWRPDVCIWTGGSSLPSLLSEIARHAEVMLLADAEAIGTGPAIPGLRRSVLSYFDRAFAIDEENRMRMLAMYPDEDRIEAPGPLREGACPPPCNDSEREDMACALAARPSWLAALCAAEEFEAVLKAHERALRSSHRLLLVICPAREEDGLRIKALAEARGLVAGLRSDGDDPEQEHQVYIADFPEEIGLWYRVVPVCFIGQTLAAGQAPQILPPAALGSALIYGPLIHSARALTDQLEERGASLRVKNPRALAEAVVLLLAPDKAARMAHNAWEAVTEGAVVLDRLVEIAGSVLDGGGIPDANP